MLLPIGAWGGLFIALKGTGQRPAAGKAHLYGDIIHGQIRGSQQLFCFFQPGGMDIVHHAHAGILPQQTAHIGGG